MALPFWLGALLQFLGTVGMFMLPMTALLLVVDFILKRKSPKYGNNRNNRRSVSGGQRR